MLSSVQEQGTDPQLDELRASRDAAHLQAVLAQLDPWQPTAGQMRPDQPWGDVVQVLNRGQAATWTVERPRRTVRRLADQPTLCPLIGRRPSVTAPLVGFYQEFHCKGSLQTPWESLRKVDDHQGDWLRVFRHIKPPVSIRSIGSRRTNRIRPNHRELSRAMKSDSEIKRRVDELLWDPDIGRMTSRWRSRMVSSR
jgi:hypothetical protein